MSEFEELTGQAPKKKTAKKKTVKRKKQVITEDLALETREVEAAAEHDEADGAPIPKASKRPEKRRPNEAARISYADRKKLAKKRLDDDKYHYHIFNDAESGHWANNIDKRIQQGYTIVTDEELREMGDAQGVAAQGIGSIASTSVGGGKKGVLMRIPREFYEEDNAAKQADVDRREEQMIPEELRNASDMYGDGLKVENQQGTLEVRRRS